MGQLYISLITCWQRTNLYGEDGLPPQTGVWTRTCSRLPTICLRNLRLLLRSRPPSAADILKSAYDQGYSKGKKAALLISQQTSADSVRGLAEPWLGNHEWRLLAVKIHGEDYVAAYELGYRKGFGDNYKRGSP
jgi:hypothetical protein